MIKKYLFLLFLCLGNPVCAQKYGFKMLDKFRSKDYDYLFEHIKALEDSSVKELMYLLSFYRKLIRKKNGEDYKRVWNYVYNSPENLKVLYSDSKIHTAKKSMGNPLIVKPILQRELYSMLRKNIVMH